MTGLPRVPLVLDEHELACVAVDGGARVDILAGVDALVARLGSAEDGRTSLRLRGLLDDAEPARPLGPLATLVHTVTEPDRMVAMYEHARSVPRVRVGVARDDVALLIAPVDEMAWQPGTVRRRLFLVEVTPVEVDDLVDEVLDGTGLEGLTQPLEPSAVELPQEVLTEALVTAQRGERDAALLQMRAAGVDRAAALALVAAGAVIGGGGGVLVQARHAGVAVQEDIGFFRPADAQGPWILVDAGAAGMVHARATTSAGVAGRVRAVAEEIR